MLLTIQIPDIYFVNHQQKSIEKKIKLYTALMMFRSGQVSAGAACEIAGIDRYTFIEECDNNNIPIIDYNISEIKNELKHYKNIKK